jgi:hypothetical protein
VRVSICQVPEPPLSTTNTRDQPVCVVRQHTSAASRPVEGAVDTTSLDLQGVRAGSEGTFWIDLQGQIGGGSSKRLTYCQVLIQTSLGGPVPQDTITAALLQSLKSGSKRAVIHRDGGKGMPN